MKNLIAIILFLISIGANADPKRIAVLHFDDHSRFDSGTGCGCIAKGTLLDRIFGGTKNRMNWNLKTGFRDLLNRKLDQSKIYEPISHNEILDAMSRQNLTIDKIFKNGSDRQKLMKTLNADAMIIGDIRKFNQERARANASRSLIESTGTQGRSTISGLSTGVQVIGYIYSATIEIEIDIYDFSGEKIAKRKISTTKRHQLGGAKIAAFEAIATEQGSDFRFGQPIQKEKPKKKFRPIVDPRQLRKIKFPSDQFDKTLFGITADTTFAKVITALRETIGPEKIEKIAEHQNEIGSAKIGKIIYVDPENADQTFINLGTAKKITAQQRLVVYAIEPLEDPDTHEILGEVKKKIGLVEVIEVQTDRLSRVRIIDGFGTIKKGDLVLIAD